MSTPDKPKDFECIRPLQVSFNHKVMEQDRKFYFVTSLTMGIDLETGEPVLETDLYKDAVESMGDAPMLDMGLPKAQGEYLVSGSWYAPGGQASPKGKVSVAVADQRKELMVFGPRQWKSGVVSQAEPITSLPLNFSRAFGGADHEHYKTGIGYKDGRLPQIENPKKPITAESYDGAPAGLGPIDFTWPQRRKYQGTYDNYLEKFYPGYPDDLDWHLFNAGWADQWTEGYWSGNESYRIEGMHPEKPVMEGTIAPFRCRCFVQYQGDKTISPEFKEVPLNMDTLWFFPDKNLVLTIYRGVFAVDDDEGSDVWRALACFERQADARRPLNYYQGALQKRIDSDDRLLNYFNTKDIIPPGMLCAMQIMQQQALAGTTKSAMSENMDAKQASVMAMVDEKIADADAQANKAQGGIPDMPSETKVDLKEQMAKPDVPDKDLDDLKAKMEQRIPGITSGDAKQVDMSEFSFEKMDQMFDDLDEFSDKKQAQVDEALGKAKEQFDEAKTRHEMAKEQLDQVDPFADRKTLTPLPRIPADKAIADLKAQVKSGKQQVVELEKDGAPADSLQGLNESINIAEDAIRKAESDFRDMYRDTAHLMEAGSSPHEDTLDDVRDRFLRAHRMGQSLAGQDWACIDLSGENLDGVDLSGCLMEQVNLSGASLKGANLTGTLLARANLSDADFSQAKMDQANIGGTQSSRAKFISVSLSEGKLSRGDFTEANFSGSDVSKMECLEANFSQTDFTGCTMPEMQFIRLNVSGAKFCEAQMGRSIFMECTAQDTIFDRAEMERVTWADTPLDRASFVGARLENGCFATTKEGITLQRANFSEAHLKQACFWRQNLEDANFEKAYAENTLFNEANMQRCKFTRMKGPSAQFRKTDLQRAEFNEVDLRQGSLSKANLKQANMANSNFYGVDFLRCTHGETNWSGANVDATILKDWSG